MGLKQILPLRVCRNFGKELVILFHRSAAVHYKKRAPREILSLLVPPPQLLASGTFRSSPLTVYVFGTFHHRDPRATNARAELKGTGHTQLSSSKHFICKPPTSLLYLIKPTLPSTLQPSQHTWPYFTSWTLPWTLFYELLLTHSLFIPFGVKPCLLLLLYINLVACISRSSLSSKAVTNSLLLLSTVYSFTKRRNKTGFSGFIKFPTCQSGPASKNFDIEIRMHISTPQKNWPCISPCSRRRGWRKRWEILENAACCDFPLDISHANYCLTFSVN